MRFRKSPATPGDRLGTRQEVPREERRHYNTVRPHSALGYRSPREFLAITAPAMPAFHQSEDSSCMRP
ncbi:integrase core domain-containing protein [Lutibaculum baratangense]|uniref:integrase core domain-containing protein n=1 Tax=Lutibaculum baratangense TaxID=1358440 RepID=UPI00041B1512